MRICTSTSQCHDSAVFFSKYVRFCTTIFAWNEVFYLTRITRHVSRPELFCTRSWDRTTHTGTINVRAQQLAVPYRTSCASDSHRPGNWNLGHDESCYCVPARIALVYERGTSRHNVMHEHGRVIDRRLNSMPGKLHFIGLDLHEITFPIKF